MPLIRYPDSNIIMEISDLVVGATIIKRKAQVINLTYSPTLKSVIVNLCIYPFRANEDGTYGDTLVNHPLFSVQTTQLTADDTSIVDATNGTILRNFGYKPTEEQIEALMQPGEEFEGFNIMYEWEFYAYMAENIEIKLNDPIRAKILAADAEGRFNNY